MNANLIVVKHCEWGVWSAKPGDGVPDNIPADVVAVLKANKAVAELGDRPVKLEAVPNQSIQS